MKMSIFNKDSKVSKKVKGAELVLAGGALFMANFFIATLAPLAISLYGLYRWLIRKNYKEGIVFVAVGVLIYIFLRTGVGEALLKLPIAIGLIMVLWGAGMMIFSKKKGGSDGTD